MRTVRHDSLPCVGVTMATKTAAAAASRTMLVIVVCSVVYTGQAAATVSVLAVN